MEVAGQHRTVCCTDTTRSWALMLSAKNAKPNPSLLAVHLLPVLLHLLGLAANSLQQLAGQLGLQSGAMTGGSTSITLVQLLRAEVPCAMSSKSAISSLRPPLFAERSTCP